ncbi:MAG: VOC family protein [Chloroflexi bacterium]|nr:VOC family protein [Chloroflexota bacterium]
MERPRIRHIALNVKDRDAGAAFYKKVFGMEEKSQGSNGTIYLSDGFVGVALISNPNMPWGINHFGFQVDSISTIEEVAETTAVANSVAAVGESMIQDVEGNRVDLSVEGWPI